MDFIVVLPRTKQTFDAVTTWVHRLSRKVYLVKSKSTDTAFDFANTLFGNILKNHAILDIIVSGRDSKFRSEFWKRILDGREV